MRSTQILVWEIQYLNTLCLYQDTVELQETRLPAIMDTSSAQVIWTMMFTVEMEIVHFSIEELGGMKIAMTQISMDSTMEHVPPMLMV